MVMMHPEAAQSQEYGKILNMCRIVVEYNQILPNMCEHVFQKVHVVLKTSKLPERNIIKHINDFVLKNTEQYKDDLAQSCRNDDRAANIWDHLEGNIYNYYYVS